MWSKSKIKEKAEKEAEKKTDGNVDDNLVLQTSPAEISLLLSGSSCSFPGQSSLLRQKSASTSNTKSAKELDSYLAVSVVPDGLTQQITELTVGGVNPPAGPILLNDTTDKQTQQQVLVVSVSDPRHFKCKGVTKGFNVPLKGGSPTAEPASKSPTRRRGSQDAS